MRFTDVDGTGNYSYEDLETFLPWFRGDVQDIYYMVMKVGIGGLLSLMGIVNNIITIIVFAKMGFKETTNISMTSIACWDLLKSLVLGVDRARSILIKYASFVVQTTFLSVMAVYLEPIGDIATHASSMLAAYVAIERCLCVSMPFTVRFLLTRKTAIVTCLAISAFVFGSYSIKFFIYRLEPMTMPIFGTNQTETSLMMFSTSFGDKHYSWIDNYTTIITSLYPVVTLCIMSVCTVIIVYNLRRSSKFRSRNTTDGSGQLSARERKINKMIVVIIIFYIVYLVPWLAYHFVITNNLMPFNLNYLLDFFSPIVVLFSLLNSSVNLYIFYFMSSEFKRTLRTLFHLSVE